MKTWKHNTVAGPALFLAVALPLCAGPMGSTSSLPDLARAMRSDVAQEFTLPRAAGVPESAAEHARLKFATKADNPANPGRAKCGLLTASMVRGGEAYDLLQIPVMTPGDVPLSYVSASDPQSGTVAFCFSTRRTGCLVYEVQPSAERTERKPALMSSVHSETATSSGDRLSAIRSKVIFDAYDEHVGGRSRVQKLAPTQLSAENGKWVLHVSLPSKAGDKWSAGEVAFEKAIASPDADWKAIEVALLSANKKACYENLDRITAAKKQWSLAEEKADGDEVVMEQVDDYIKGGHPVCPDGGEYTYGPLGAAPACTVHGSLQ